MLLQQDHIESDIMLSKKKKKPFPDVGSAVSLQSLF